MWTTNEWFVERQLTSGRSKSLGYTRVPNFEKPLLKIYDDCTKTVTVFRGGGARWAAPAFFFFPDRRCRGRWSSPENNGSSRWRAKEEGEVIALPEKINTCTIRVRLLYAHVSTRCTRLVDPPKTVKITIIKTQPNRCARPRRQ